jgi:rod shape-determining protein MreD
MRTNWVVLCTLLLVIIESSVIPWLVPSAWSERLLPHLSFIITILAAGFAGRHKAFLIGLSFGLLQDILFYGHLIGPYGFAMGLIGYAAGLVSERRIHFTLGYFIWMMIFGGIVLDTIIYYIYHLFRLTKLSYGYVFYWQIAPTVLLQLFIALLIYVPFRRYLVKPSNSSGEEGME